MSELRYETLVLRRPGLTRDVPAGDNDDLRWVANTSTLIFGNRDAVLVDTFLTIDENQRLIEWIKAHHRNLTYIFLTHGHGDHAYGVEQLLQAFPEAHAVATSGTVSETRRESGDEYGRSMRRADHRTVTLVRRRFTAPGRAGGSSPVKS